QLKSLGHSISLRSGISAILARRRHCTRIVMYHGVPNEREPFFRKQMIYLARHFPVVPLERVITMLASPVIPHPDDIALTFDDGLKNHVTCVSLVLRDLGIPATLCVCPGLLGGSRWLWNHEARCRLQTLTQSQFPSTTKRLGISCSSAEEIVE